MTSRILHERLSNQTAQANKIERRSIVRSIRIYAIIVAASLIAAFGIAEIYLRVAYADGLSFGAHRGPFVARFERDFQFNRYDGPSRGPEVTGPKDEHTVRILVQGDSITWGQGVKREDELFPSVLAERLRSAGEEVEVAVLARPGREIDGHLEQIGKWGAAIAPDIIIYQWFINDVEIDKTHRPERGRLWRQLLFPGIVTRYSYLWFLLEYRTETAADGEPYETYVLQHFGKGSEGWDLFAEQFRAWAAEAKRLTPNVVVAFYPYLLDPPEFPMLEFHGWLAELCAEEGIATIDLMKPLGVFRDDLTRTYASPFDAHPNVETHALIADALYARLRELWPDLLDRGADKVAHQHNST